MHVTIAWALLALALVLVVLGHVAYAREADSSLGISAWIASAAIAIVTLVYVLLFPVWWAVQHIPISGLDIAHIGVPFCFAAILAVANLVQIKRKVGDA